MNQRVQILMIIDVTHTDYPGAWSEEDVLLDFGFIPGSNRPPIVKVNATQRDSVAEAVIVLVQHLMQSYAA